MNTKVVIIGGGPAGLMVANTLDSKNIDYVLVEKNPILGKKLLLTGGGRCNVTNKYSVKEFINNLTIKHGKFLYSALSSFGTKNVIEYFESKGVSLKQEEGFKYFPVTNKSIDIVNALSRDLKGQVLLNTKVTNIYKKERYIVKTESVTINADYVIMSTGSKSFPKTGSTGEGMRFAKEFGHKITPFYPAETNVYSSYIKQEKEHLQGVSITQSNVKINGTRHQHNGGLMFTHFGLGGPVIQHLSEYCYFSLLEGKTVLSVSLTDMSEIEINHIFDKDSNNDIFILKLIQSATTKRVSSYILSRNNIPNKRLIEVSKKEINKVKEDLLRFQVPIDSVEVAENAYVNGGGVSVKEINPKSFESKLNEGLYIVGELTDLHGPIGGYNITIALSSGHSAAKDIITKEQQ